MLDKKLLSNCKQVPNSCNVNENIMVIEGRALFEEDLCSGERIMGCLPDLNDMAENSFIGSLTNNVGCNV